MQHRSSEASQRVEAIPGIAVIGATAIVATVALRQTVLIEILRDRLDELMPEPLSRVQHEQRQRKPWIALLATAQRTP